MRDPDKAARPDAVGTERYAQPSPGDLHRYAELIGRQRSMRWPAPQSVDTAMQIAVDLSASTQGVETAIERSRRLLDLKRGWDDEDALPCAEAWRRATSFLRRQAEWAARYVGFTLDPPEIMPLSDGSIDLHWDTADYELLVNVPGDPKLPATFYGDDRGGQHVKGTVTADSVDEDLLQWITRRLSRNGRKSASPARTTSTSEYIVST